MTAPVTGHPVLLPVPPAGGFTVADLPALAEAVDARFELLDGQVIISGPEIMWHDEAADLLREAMRRAFPPVLAVARAKGIDLGGSMPVADIIAVPRAALTAGTRVVRPADVLLAVEVTSPATWTRDRVLRPHQYAHAGIPWYWRVDSEDGATVIRVFGLHPDGGYAPTGTYRDRLTFTHPFQVDTEIPEITW